jgi:hypothetical protein
MTGALRLRSVWFPARAAYHRSRSGVDRSIFFFATTALKLLTALNTCDRAIRWPAQRKIGYKALLQSYPCLGRREIRRSLYLFMVSPKLKTTYAS